MQTEKRCTKCQSVKPYAEFNRDRTRPDGHDYHCRKCCSTGNLRGRNMRALIFRPDYVKPAPKKRVIRTEEDIRAACFSPEVQERFWRQVDRRGDDECWPWKGYAKPETGGNFRILSKKFKASRLSLAWKLGREIKPGHFACHHCDNPPCVNPRHLFEGTVMDNFQDMLAKGRDNMRGDGRKSVITPSAVREIRASPLSHSLLAERYGVCQTTIHNIKTRRRWRHVEDVAP